MTITSSRAISGPAIIAGLGGGNAVGTNAVAVGATLTNSLSTGNATNPNFVIQVGVKTGSGATQATATTALTLIGETLVAQFAGNIVLPASATIGNLVAGGNLTITTNQAVVFTPGGFAAASVRIESLTTTSGQISIGALGLIGFASVNTPVGGVDAFFTRGGVANIQLGAAAVDTAPVAQTFSVQDVLAGGTTNVAGANFTIAGSQGKGTGVGGAVIIQTAPAGTTGSTVNPLATALTIYGSGDVGIGSGAAIATTATAGFGLMPTCAGAPTGAPPNAGLGKAAFIFDTSTSQLWISISGSSWKQPKTPAGAATVTWQ